MLSSSYQLPSFTKEERKDRERGKGEGEKGGRGKEKRHALGGLRGCLRPALAHAWPAGAARACLRAEDARRLSGRVLSITHADSDGSQGVGAQWGRGCPLPRGLFRGAEAIESTGPARSLRALACGHGGRTGARAVPSLHAHCPEEDTWDWLREKSNSKVSLAAIRVPGKPLSGWEKSPCPRTRAKVPGR